ncbi:BON domain protein [Lyngbya aestuarii BL J]|uniref:BON domain protein n=2 Tax=Lyngbya aestuarii TaxID=118322 RepID=U7QI92_9CYAN|nr:BON domain protein [Lyngbya aestuarii BL J]
MQFSINRTSQKQIFRLFSAGMLATVFSLGMTGCQSPSQTLTNSDNEVLETEPDINDTEMVVSEDPFTDAEITEAIERELEISRGISPASILVATNEGIVTLSGSVNNILAQERAERIASMIKGTRAVINEINVEPVPRTDAEILENINSALVNDPVTEVWEIEPVVNNGVVTLGGEVDSWQEKQLASRVAKGVAGVKQIDNQISINYKTQRSAPEIEQDIQSALQWDARVDSRLINIEVDGTQAILSGIVGSAFEKSLVITDAYVIGVMSVDANDLEVEPWADEERMRTEIVPELKDTAIRDAVQDALLYDPRVAAFNLNVAVDEGAVTLSGTVDNLKAKRAAAQDARNTTGVWRVESNINVQPQTELTDNEIVEKIITRLQRDPYVNRQEIGVTVEEGIVRLNGSVESYFEKWQAGDVAALAQGVTGVINQLEVDYNLPAEETSFYDWDPITEDYDYNYDNSVFSDRSDEALATAIDAQLLWSPFVDEQQVEVSVDDGVARLTGTVDSWYEYAQATEEAYEGGAVTVMNNLEVSPNSNPLN